MCDHADQDTFIPHSQYGNKVLIEYAVNYLSAKQALSVNELNLLLNFGNAPASSQEMFSNYYRVLDAISQFGYLLQNHPYLKEHLITLKLESSGTLYEASVNEHFSTMLSQIQYTNLKKLTVNLCGETIKTGLLPILSKTRLTHLKLNHFFWEPLVISEMLDVLPTTKLTHLICSTGISLAELKKLHQILPNTNIACLHVDKVGESTSFAETIETLDQLFTILPNTKITSLKIPFLGFFDGNNGEAEPLYRKILDVLPKTGIVALDIFQSRAIRLSGLYKEMDEEIQKLCKLNLEKRQMATDIWFKVFKGHVLKNTSKPLFPTDVSGTILSFLYPQHISIVHNLSEQVDEFTNNAQHAKAKYLTEQKQLTYIKIQQLIQSYHAANPEHALRIAASKGDNNAVSLLLNSNINIDVNQPGEKSGKTALHQAIMNLTEKFIHNNYIIPTGITEEMIHRTNEEICSYENYRVVNAYYECINRLLIAGAIEIKDNQGKLPRDYAATSGEVSAMISCLFKLEKFFLEQDNEQNKSVTLKPVPY